VTPRACNAAEYKRSRLSGELNAWYDASVALASWQATPAPIVTPWHGSC
jgi:hypothetical protein